MPKRKVPLAEGKIYHILSKSIAGFKIFRNDLEYERIRDIVKYYKTENSSLRFSAFLEIKNKDNFYQKYFKDTKKIVEVIAYCFMPTHIHLILKQVRKDGISIFMKNILNSYTQYFNRKAKRKGPLWESRFKNLLVGTDEYLFHLTRYIHLNPVTAHLVEKPEEWNFSSYKEFLEKIEEKKIICNYSEVLDIKPKEYKIFVDSRISYQRELAEIKKLFIE